jgi:broad specificity phosphatase PhoE
VLDLLTTIGVANQYPVEAERRRWLGKFYHRPPGGESWADVVLRVRSFMRDLNDLPDGARVVIMCHDALVLLFRYVCEHLNEQQVLEIGANDPVRNVSLTQYSRAADRSWQLLRYNDVTHLEESGAPITEHRGEVDARATR